MGSQNRDETNKSGAVSSSSYLEYNLNQGHLAYPYSKAVVNSHIPATMGISAVYTRVLKWAGPGGG